MTKVAKMTVADKFVAVSEFLKEHNAPADIVEFIEGRISQEAKARARAKEKRAESGEKKDAANSEYYTSLRNAIMSVMTSEFQSGAALLAAAPFEKKAIAPQVKTALKPAIESGHVIEGKIKVTVTDKNGLSREALHTAYKLA